MIKTVYQTAPDSGFVGVVELDESYRDPRRPDRWAIPGGCVETAPPKDKDGFDRVYKDGAWSYVEQAKDDKPEQPEATFVDLQQAKLAEIDTQTKQHITGGFVSNTKGTLNTYDSADADQLTFAAMYAASRSADFAMTEPYNGSIPIRAVPDGQVDKIIIGHNAAEMQKLMDDLALHIGTCKQIGWQLQAAAMSATTKEELDQIVWVE